MSNNSKKKEGEDAPASKPASATTTQAVSEAAPNFGDFATDDSDMPF